MGDKDSVVAEEDSADEASSATGAGSEAGLEGALPDFNVDCTASAQGPDVV